MTEFTHDGELISKAIKTVNHHCPSSLKGLTICITGIVQGYKGCGAETAAQLHGAMTRKNVSSKTQLLVIGHNAGRDKINRAQKYNTPTITAREFKALLG